MSDNNTIHAFKGMDKDMKCRGFQYEVGKTYETDTSKACESGFHACEAPLDVLRYYPPAEGNRYFEVEQSGELDRNGEGSKVASTKITVGAEIGIPGLVKAHVEWVKSNIKDEKTATNTGDYSAATNTGYYSAATNTGDYSAATNTGDCSAATNTGNRSAATNTGDYSAATNTGDYSAATNTGDYSAATNTGNRSAATNTGYYSAATNTGNRSAATNTGNCSAATNTGNRSAAEVSGKDSIAIASGLCGKARASIGSAIVLVERDNHYKIKAVKAVVIDGETYKPDVWYTLKGGEIVEVE